MAISQICRNAFMRSLSTCIGRPRTSSVTTSNIPPGPVSCALTSAAVGMTRHCVSLTRDVRLVLCSPEGDVFGALPRFEVVLPWWQEVAEIIDGVRDRFGVDVTIVRLLETD